MKYDYLIMNKTLITILFIITLSGCTPRSIISTLDDVDTYIMERPDSALQVIESMDRSLLKTERSRAHHALLHAMALDKNYIDVTDDSIAQVAVDYYSRRGPEKRKARAYYYLGLAYYYQQNYDKAILEFTRAEEVAETCDSLYWGMTKSLQAGAYSATYNDIETLNCLQKAYDIYFSISDIFKSQSVQLKIANQYLNQFEYNIADSLLTDLINSDYVDNMIKSEAINSYAYLKMIQPIRNPYKSIELYDSIYQDYIMTNQDYWAYAFALSLVGRKAESDEIVKELASVDTTSSASYWQYLISKYEGEYEKALSFLEESGYKDNTVISQALNQSLSLVQRDYYESQSELAEYKVKNRTLTMTSVIVAAFLIITLLVFFVSRYIILQKEEKDSYIRYADEISRQLQILQNETDSIPALKRKYLELYKSKFEDLRVLCDNYLQYKDRTDAEKKMYGQVVKMVNELRNDVDHNAELETMLNADLDNIMTNIRNEIKMKETDYSIYSYLVIGFDATTISRLLDVSVNTVYIRKSRIKAMIESSSAEHKNQFLEILS